MRVFFRLAANRTRRQGSLGQHFQSAEECIGSLQRLLWSRVNLLKAGLDKAAGVFDQYQCVAICAVIFSARGFNKLFQRRDNRGQGLYAGCMRRAFQRMQRAGQIVGIGGCVPTFRLCQELAQCLQVGLGLAFKNIEQYRIDQLVAFIVCAIVIAAGRCDLRAGGLVLFERADLSVVRHRAGFEDFAIGQRVGARFKWGGIQRRWAAGFEIADQIRRDCNHILKQLTGVVAHENAAVDDPVQQVFNGPGHFAHRRSTHHAAAALERVECPAHFRQCGTVVVLAQ